MFLHALHGYSSRKMTTIAAISTAPGMGAVALVRVSGPESWAAVRAVFDGAKSDPAPRKAYFGKIRDGANVIDEVLVTFFRGPASYTGEDLVEIGCHGGVLVSAKVLEVLLKQGLHLAEPGEFTQRAFLNGKMDLTQAEAVMDLINAQTPLALRAATEQLEGRIGQETNEIRESLLAIAAHLEAYIDFPEEGIDPTVGLALADQMKGACNRVDSLLATANEGRILREGVRLAIVGKPNAGKSSLLNRLLGYERAIVSEIPGTTRDTVEEVASLRGVPFRIIDTAGLRQSEDRIEQAGIERTYRAIERADVVLHVVDATDDETIQMLSHDKPKIIAINKVDQIRNPQPSKARQTAAGSPEGEASPSQSAVRNCPISCLTGEGMPELVDQLVAAAGAWTSTERDSLAAINARHQACLSRAREALIAAEKALRDQIDPELVAVDLRGALAAIAEVTGVIDTEELLGKIFSTFCIGK